MHAQAYRMRDELAVEMSVLAQVSPMRRQRADAPASAQGSPMRPQQAAAPTLAPASDAAPPPPWTFSTRMFGPSTTLCKAEAKDVFPDKYENGRFKHMGTVGRGAFSVVFKAKDSKVGGEVAVKAVQMPKDEQTRKALKKEIEILKQLDHPGIVKLHENVECMDGVLHLVMELLPGTTLRTLLDQRGALSEVEVVPIARQLVAALDYLHTQARVVHRDLKPENIMPNAPLPANAATPLSRVPGLVWKICDFGVSCRVRGGQGAGAAGSVETLFFKVTCPYGRCAAQAVVPPRVKGNKMSKGLADQEKIRCPNCGRAFWGVFGREGAWSRTPGGASQLESPTDDAREGGDPVPETAPEVDQEATLGGTAGYMAPEMLAVDLALRRGTAISPEMIAGLSAPALDIFSLGRILYFLLTGVHPSSGFQFEKLESFSRSLARPFSAKKGTGTKRFQMRKNLSTGAQALIVALTAEVATERPAAASPAIRKWLQMMEHHVWVSVVSRYGQRSRVAQVLKAKRFNPDVDSGVLAHPVSVLEEGGGEGGGGEGGGEGGGGDRGGGEGGRDGGGGGDGGDGGGGEGGGEGGGGEGDGEGGGGGGGGDGGGGGGDGGGGGGGGDGDGGGGGGGGGDGGRGGGGGGGGDGGGVGGDDGGGGGGGGD